jgi:hypothetical protein
VISGSVILDFGEASAGVRALSAKGGSEGVKLCWASASRPQCCAGRCWRRRMLGQKQNHSGHGARVRDPRACTARVRHALSETHRAWSTCRNRALPQLGLRQMTKPVFFRRQRLERAPLDLARAAEKPGEFVGDVQGDFHASIPGVSRRPREGDCVADLGEADDVGEAPAKAETSRNRRCDLRLARRPLS